MSIYRKSLLLLIAFLLTGFIAIAEEQDNRPTPATLITKLFEVPEAERYSVAHKLAEFDAAAIENAMSFVPASAEPAQIVVLLSVLVPKNVMDPFDAFFKKVMDGGDENARLALLDLLSYAVPVEAMPKVFSQLSQIADRDSGPIESIRVIRTIWTSLVFMPGARPLLVENNFKIPKKLQEPLRLMLNSEAAEFIKAEAAVTLGEMGVTDSSVMDVVKRISNDPTPLGARARSVLLGHPIYDEVVRRAQMLHVDQSKLDSWRLVMEACKGLAVSLDRHSAFFDPDGVKSWDESRSGEYGGIGAYVSVRDNTFIISRPFYNGPAYKAGLRSGDRIFDVEGTIMVGNDLEDLVRRLKGPPGTQVRVKIYRKGWTKARDFVLTRAKIDVPNIHTSKLPGNLAYIRLDSFSEKATDQMVEAISKIKEWKPAGLVFDLRGNPGGGLQSAVEIVSMFIDKGKMVVFEEGRPEIWSRQNHFSVNKPKFEGPVVVLVNDLSASASEIVSGALRDYKRATLVGVKTYGKGSVQIVFWVANSDFKCQFKLTIASYFLPSGECIHEKGIEPHITIEPEEVQGWVFDEMARLRESGVLTSYIDKLLQNKELANALAENDFGDPGRYPGFDEWRSSIETILGRDMLRYIVNDELRRIVQDEIGHEFSCNPGSDNQLQAGMLAVLRSAGLEPAKIEDMVPFVEKEIKRKAAEQAAKEREEGLKGE